MKNRAKYKIVPIPVSQGIFRIYKRVWWGWKYLDNATSKSSAEDQLHWLLTEPTYYNSEGNKIND